MLDGLIVALLLMIVVFHVVARTKKGSLARLAPAWASDEFTTAQAPHEAYRRALHWAKNCGLGLDDRDDEGRRLLLVQQPSVLHYGYWYPVEVEAAGDGASIRVGVRSKLYSHGRPARKGLQWCMDGLRAAMEAD